MAQNKKQKDLSHIFSPRKQFRFAVHLFTEGKTELDYLQKIAKDHNVRINLVKRVSAPVVLLSQAMTWAVTHSQFMRTQSDRNRVWVIFDDDAKAKDMSEVVKLWKKCPEICMEKCNIRDRKRCKNNDVIAKVNVAFMTPCVEVWGLMCLENYSDMTFSLDRHKIQSELHRHMRSYVHDGHPYFEVERMRQWQKACDKAQEWVRTYGKFPQCINASRYAGIAPLVHEIMLGDLEGRTLVNMSQ